MRRVTNEFIEHCNALRADIRSLEISTRALMNAEAFSQTTSDPSENTGEARANVMLAVRHIEDARMRLGKVIQAMDGGVSCYDKKS